MAAAMGVLLSLSQLIARWNCKSSMGFTEGKVAAIPVK